MKTSTDVIEAGYNTIIHNDVEMRIVGGKDNILYIQERKGSEVLSIEVEKVQKFLYFR